MNNKYRAHSICVYYYNIYIIIRIIYIYTTREIRFFRNSLQRLQQLIKSHINYLLINYLRVVTYAVNTAYLCGYNRLQQPTTIKSLQQRYNTYNAYYQNIMGVVYVVGYLSFFLNYIFYYE